LYTEAGSSREIYSPDDDDEEHGDGDCVGGGGALAPWPCGHITTYSAFFVGRSSVRT